MGKGLKLEVWGNAETMNINEVVYVNIIQSRYFQSLQNMNGYHELIDEIYNNVTYLDPFIKGTIASSAFCLLYKLFTVGLTVNQINGLLNHQDSPYIRAIGVLYLRYSTPPQDLIDWYESCFEETEKFTIDRMGKMNMTMGELCKMLLTQQKFLGTILPRIPVPIMKEVEKRLADMERTKKRNHNHDSAATTTSASSASVGNKKRPSSPSSYDRSRNSSRYRSKSPDGRRRGRSYEPEDDYRKDSRSDRDDYRRRRDDGGRRRDYDERGGDPYYRRDEDRSRKYENDRYPSSSERSYQSHHHNNHKSREDRKDHDSIKEVRDIEIDYN